MQDDPRAVFIRKLVDEGTSDEDIVATLKVYDQQHPKRSTVDKAGAVVKGAAKGLISDPLQLPSIVEAGKALPDVARAAAHDETNFMGVPIRTVKEFAKGSGGALVQLGALPYTLGRSIGDSLPVSMGGKPEVKGSSALSAIDPARDTEDPYEAYPRRIGNVAALLYAPRMIGAAKAASAARAGEVAAGPKPSWWGKAVVQPSVASSTEPLTVNPAIKGVATVPPTGSRPITTAPWMRMNVPGGGAGASTVPPTPPAGGVRTPPLGLPASSARPAPPPGVRLVKNPTNPMAEAARQAVEEAQATTPGGVELPPEPVQPRVTHPSEAQVKALVKAAEERKAKEALAKAAAAKATQPPAPAPAATPAPVAEPPATPPTLLQKIESALSDQRGEIDLTGSHGIDPLPTPLAPGHPGLGKTAAEWAQEMATLRTTKPRPIAKLFGTNGPSPTQLAKWEADMKAWNRTYNAASRLQKSSLAFENANAANAGGKVVPPGGEPSAPPVMPTDVERQLAEAHDFISEWEKGGAGRAALLERKLTPQQRTSLKMAVASRPGELPELRQALGLSEPPATQPGFQPGKTVTLPEMVAKYGKERAAQRMGMKVSELEARLEAEGDPAKLEALLRKSEGAAETNRRLGTASPSTGMLPDKAVERIRAAAEKEKAAGGLTDKTRALADRIHSERPGDPRLYAGIDPRFLWGMAKKHPALAGAVTGGTVGALAGAEGDNDNTKLGKAALGAGGGALLGASLANPKRALEAALNITSNSMLSGGAIAKNLITLGGGAVRSAIENQTPGQGRLGAAKQLVSPSKIGANQRAYWQGTANVNPRTNPLSTAPSRIPPKWQRLALPANIIGGIDEMGTQAFRRAGMTKRNIDRNLLTAHRNIIRGGLQREIDQFPMRPGELPDKELDTLARIIVRFQRVPTNIINEGGKEALHLFHRPFTARSALNAAQMAGSYELGKWAKKSPRNRFLALLALAGAGPNTALSTLAMAGGYGPQSLRLLGGLTPVPEFELPLNRAAAGRDVGLPPAAVTAYRHLFENK